MNKGMPKPQPNKSLNQQFREGMFFLIIAYFFLYVVGQFFEFLFHPFTNTSATPEEMEKRIRERILKKQNARIRRMMRFHRDMNDPIVQFHLRFVNEPGNYEGDPDNSIYKEWFNEWRNGNIIDTEMRCAPQVFLKPKKMNSNFLDYLKIQWDLHKKDSALKRGLFCRIISKYYPEFTPTMNGLEEDIAQYEAEITESRLRNELSDEIQRFGLPVEVASYLMDVPVEELHDKASAFKRCIEKGYGVDACIYGIERNLKDDMIEVIHEVIENTGLPAKVGYAYAKQEIDIKGIEYLSNQMSFVLESYGENAFEFIAGKNVTPYDEFLELYLKELKGTKAAKRLCEEK